MVAVGIACGIGLSSLGDDVKAALTSSENTLTLRSDLLADQTVQVGAYQGDLYSAELPTAMKAIDSRNFRLALTALEKIKDRVDAHIKNIDQNRLAVIVGTSTSGIADNEPVLKQYFEQKNVAVSYKKQEMGCLARGLQAHLGWTGIAYTISTACSSSGKAFAAGQRLIEAGLADAVLVGGVDTLCQLTLNGFNSLESLSSQQCQPCGQRRDGINIGEAASLFLLTKDVAPVMLMGHGESMDAWHISAPHPEGIGAQSAMCRALDAAAISPSCIDYLNLHGTATPQNDAMEIHAVRQVFGENNVALSSTKHKTGHCLGAASALEAYICYRILLDQSWLPLHQSGEIDMQLKDQNYVRDYKMNKPICYVMSNSFAFGGSNVSLVFGISKS
ncbi:beta-ketoacyl-ACP synthase [Acinetobacter rathckeae]|uniref:beta-ketoacyl-ACP synthase n=1 Tax=Acinetobacter rathckeae TaxID=2605272 RepID=UPI0018A30EB8|nr:beta-ketoacyl-ACP synthase [Acinetobacter rathckeae]MBF7687796.1 beta-ketoacyl-ACP synthase [Acinetobacter rathckeae]MBF7687981.1 beta-ketoacyl-ACP synthase [Acinetobacter rathckeae]MBF7695965.1 beta-ketoacyl-ACP synthase [Acinetobacter rathckeae]